ncbi:MAG: hypothetical protein A2885_20125 [Sphingopyxis sp. RIFCSPHIGHO2_01_FULL_65_24]|nr:MAG: hypothetical protein A2885_20125 [Sphingopyxis sp. RIFCSPHIGHO2_01_FULL_65_24]
MAGNSKPMRPSLYNKARLFMFWTLSVFLTFPIWIALLDRHFGRPGIIAGMMFWLGHGVASMHLFRCPDCGLSPFLSRKSLFAWATPWPRRTCGHCGRNHQAGA